MNEFEIEYDGVALKAEFGGGASCSGCYFEGNGSPSWCCANKINCVVNNELVIFVEKQQ